MNKLKESPEQSEKELNDLFSEMPTELSVLVELPSKGRFYNGFKGMTVFPLTFEDEQRIFTSKNKNINPINEIIAKCTKGVNINDLLCIDKIFLLLKIKELSYGPDYKFDTVCPRCEFRSETTIDVSKNLPINFVPDNFEDPREIELPVLKKKVKVRFPRVLDEQYLIDIDTALTNLFRFVVSINDNEKPEFIAKALKKMHIKDMKIISNAIHHNELGVDARFIFKCPQCNYETAMGVPIDAGFFSVT
jgi:hypothetical protein